MITRYLPITVFCCLFGFASVDAVAQGDIAPEIGQIVLKPTIPASYVGCASANRSEEERAACSASKVNAHIARTLNYPESAREERIQGVVMVSFVLDTEGAVQRVKVLRDIGGGCGQEAKRVVEAMPDWAPASDKGRLVATQFTLPISFGLTEGMFDYELSFGDLPDGEVYMDEVIDVVSSTTPKVTDGQGAPLPITEVVYTFERGGDRRQLVTTGGKSPGRTEFKEFMGRRPGRLTIEANVVEGMDIRPVSRAFVVVR